MPKIVTYRLDGYDGGLGQQPEPSSGGIFQLSDTHWGLTIPERTTGVSAGLLHSRLSVEPVDRRRCLLRLDTDGGDSCAMILLARADSVQKVIALRMSNLATVSDALAGVAMGQWWRNPQAFDDFGPLRTRSVGGVRYEGSWWKDDRVRPNRRRAVLDFGPEGLVLRKWRRKMTISWALVDTLEIEDGAAPPSTPGTGRGATEGDPGTGASIIVRSATDRTARFSTPLMSADSVRHQLAPILRLLEPSPKWPEHTFVGP